MKQLLTMILSLGLMIAPVKEAIAEGGAAKQILQMSNGIVGSSILVKCTLGSTQFSLPVYMAGGVVFILSEVTGGKKKKQDVNANSVKLDNLKTTMAEGGDYQRAAVDMQIADEKSNLDFVQKRRKWMMALKVIYGTATGLALTELIMRGYPLFKPDLGGCTPKPGTDAPALAMFATAYGALASSGSITGMAVGVAASEAMKHFLPKLAIGTKVADLGITVLNTAEGRMAFFAVTGMLVGLLDKDLQKEEDRIKSNLATLEKVKAQFDGPTNSIAEGSSSNPGNNPSETGANLKDPSKGQYALTNLPTASALPKTCYSQSAKGEVIYSESACSNPMKIPRPPFNGKFDIPALQTSANISSDLAQAFAEGNIGQAEIAAGKLASMAGQINKINEELTKKVNDKLIAEGKKPIDINAELDRQMTALNKGLNEASSGSSKSSLASLSSTENAKVSETEKTEGENSNVANGALVNSAAVPGAAGIDLSSIGSGDVGGTSVEEGAQDSRLASLDESLEQYEDSQSDIAKDPGVSIFKQVSNRYFLNYNKIFNRKEIAPPMAPASK